ncbi:hypothetical protein N7451_010504 [Penicillium sp. IBT 35674x]|nr:hypothetical protein N7451_010504 [Penicillium sp. IBT 35674x]
MSNADRTEADRIDGDVDENVGHGQNRVGRRKRRCKAVQRSLGLNTLKRDEEEEKGEKEGEVGEQANNFISERQVAEQ